MTPEEALHIAKVVCLWSFDNVIHADRTVIRQRAKELSDNYSAGVEQATAEYILRKANPVDRSFLR